MCYPILKYLGNQMTCTCPWRRAMIDQLVEMTWQEQQLKPVGGLDNLRHREDEVIGRICARTVHLILSRQGPGDEHIRMYLHRCVLFSNSKSSRTLKRVHFCFKETFSYSRWYWCAATDWSICSCLWINWHIATMTHLWVRRWIDKHCKHSLHRMLYRQHWRQINL